MDEHAKQTTLREWLSLHSDLFGVVAGVLWVANFFWWFIWQPHGSMFFVSVGVSVTSVFAAVSYRVFVSNHEQVETIGAHMQGALAPPRTIATATQQEERAQERVQESTIIGPKPEPNIKCLPEDGLFVVELDRHQAFRQSNYHGAGALRPVAAAFTNAIKPPQKVAPVTNVTA